jgi:hypothetical protein
MRVWCPHCEAKAVITSRTEQTRQVADLYCRCTDSKCGASFVYTLAYRHTLNPPIQTTAQLAQSLIGARE